MEIRRARLDDLEALARVHCDAWRESHSDLFPGWFVQTRNMELFRTRWGRYLRDEQNETVVALADGEICGFVHYGFPSPKKGPGIGEVHKVYLLPEARGKGVGGILLREGEMGLAKLGYPQGFLAAAADHPRAVSFYRKHGWTESKEPWTQEFEGVSVRVQEMTKSLVL